MIRRFFLAGILAAIAATGWSDVIDPAEMDPGTIIGARKEAMHTISANFAGIRDAVESGDLDAAAGHARNIATLTQMLPVLFQEPYASSYPSDARFAFSGGPTDEIVQLAMNLRNAALDIVDAGSIDEVDARSFGGTCAACHNPFRVRR